MKIGLISKFGAADGLCVRSQHVLNGLVTLGHEVHAFTQVTDVPNLPDSHVHTFPAVQVNPHFWLDSPRVGKMIADECKRNEIDVLHIQMNSSTTEFLLPIFKHFLPPIVVTFHLAYADGNPLIRTFFEFAWKVSVMACKVYDRVVLVDPSQKSIFTRLGVSEEKLTVVPNGVDTRLFIPNTNSKPNERVEFVYVGRLSVEKGIHVLLKAFRKYHKYNPYSRLTLVGEGILKHIFQKSYDGDSVRWLGQIDHSKVPKVLQNADVFVLPQSIGGLGLSVMEAMSCGLPVITTKIGETANLLSSEEGILVEPDDDDAIYNAMKMLGEDEALRRSMGVKCRQKIESKYSWTTQVRLLEDIYANLLNQ
ncbi:MAG: glycosyltransferase family 4 protein [Candidatus Thorarchaeota archaeon]